MIFHQKSINMCYNISKMRELTFELGIRKSFLEKVTIKTYFESLDFDKQKYKGIYNRAFHVQKTS